MSRSTNPENQQSAYSDSHNAWGKTWRSVAVCGLSSKLQWPEGGMPGEAELAALAWRSSCGFLEKYLSGFPPQPHLTSSHCQPAVRSGASSAHLCSVAFWGFSFKQNLSCSKIIHLNGIVMFHNSRPNVQLNQKLLVKVRFISEMHWSLWHASVAF